MKFNFKKMGNIEYPRQFIEEGAQGAVMVGATNLHTDFAGRQALFGDEETGIPSIYDLLDLSKCDSSEVNF